MKLALIHNTIYKYASGSPTAVGGAERQYWLLARALAATGWSVVVGVSEGLETGARTVIDDVQFVGIGRGCGHILTAWYRFLLSEQPDWWYWRCATHLLGPSFAMAKSLKVRTIFSAALDLDVIPRRALFLRPQLWPLYQWGLAWSDRIFVQHGGQLYALAENLRLKTFVVPSIAGEARAAKPHSERSKTIAWVGQLKHPKRPDLIVRMARKLTNLQFIVCGGPSTFMSPAGYSDRIMAELRDLPNVDYRGQVPPDEALRVIAGSALLLSTADEEGFPNTFLQAWSSGTPVVSLSIDPDHVIERNGLGVVSRSVERALAAIESLIDSPERRDEIAAGARHYVNAYHSEAAVVKVFNEAVQGDRSKL